VVLGFSSLKNKLYFIFKENVKMVKNSKKGFTLVELVIVIAILAILAAIAIPVVNSIINTASKNGALSDAQSIELAVKECQADIAARNDEVYAGQQITTTTGTRTIPKASSGHATITIADVAAVKGIEDAFKIVTYNGVDYAPYWDKDTDSCVYLAPNAVTGKAAKFAQLGTDAVTASGASVATIPAYANSANCVLLLASDSANGVNTTAHNQTGAIKIEAL
jgi:prepilin-type N-terminal cleavage/methylation domain-containing protein